MLTNGELDIEESFTLFISHLQKSCKFQNKHRNKKIHNPCYKEKKDFYGFNSHHSFAAAPLTH